MCTFQASPDIGGILPIKRPLKPSGVRKKVAAAQFLHDLVRNYSAGGAHWKALIAMSYAVGLNSRMI